MPVKIRSPKESPVLPEWMRALGGGEDVTSLDLSGAITPAITVAAGGPANIPKLKANGAKLIERLRTIGYLPSIHDNVLTGQPRRLEPEVLEQLSWMQQKYPRLFGHFTDITATDEGPSVLARGGRSAMGRMVPTDDAGRYMYTAGKRGRLELNPDLVKLKRGEGKLPVDTVGHEMLHLKDRVLVPNMMEKYEEANKLYGYERNPFEVRARQQGSLSELKYRKQTNTPPAQRTISDDVDDFMEMLRSAFRFGR